MFKIIAIVLISLHFLFSLFLGILEYKSRNRGIPARLNDVFDEERYLKWKAYQTEKIRVEMISHSVSFALILGLILGNVFALATQNIANPYVATIVILSIYLGSDTIVGIPFSYISSIRIEGKYGFNKASLRTFVADQIKTLLIAAALFLGLSCFFIFLYEAIGNYILILFTGVVFLFMLLISFLYPVLSKAFNKFTPLEEGELREALTKMLESHHYQVRDIKVMDASRRTTKLNAYFNGFGKSKTIVLYDNLLEAMNNEQILAVFAHEMGHGLHKDTLKNSLFSPIQILLLVVFAWLLVYFPSIYLDFGFAGLSYGMAILLLFVAVLPLGSTVMGILTSYLSKKAEYRADEQAVKEGYGDYLVSALKVLFRENLGDLNPHPLIVLLSYSHPTLLQMVEHIDQLTNKE